MNETVTELATTVSEKARNSTISPVKEAFEFIEGCFARSRKRHAERYGCAA